MPEAWQESSKDLTPHSHFNAKEQQNDDKSHKKSGSAVLFTCYLKELLWRNRLHELVEDNSGELARQRTAVSLKMKMASLKWTPARSGPRWRSICPERQLQLLFLTILWIAAAAFRPQGRVWRREQLLYLRKIRPWGTLHHRQADLAAAGILQPQHLR